MYLDHTLDLDFRSAKSLHFLATYLDRIFAQRILSQKLKSPITLHKFQTNNV